MLQVHHLVGAAGGDGGGAGAAGSCGSNSPAHTGGAGAGGNSLTSPGSVNYSVSNTGTINEHKDNASKNCTQ